MSLDMFSLLFSCLVVVTLFSLFVFFVVRFFVFVICWLFVDI